MISAIENTTPIAQSPFAVVPISLSFHFLKNANLVTCGNPGSIQWQSSPWLLSLLPLVPPLTRSDADGPAEDGAEPVPSAAVVGRAVQVLAEVLRPGKKIAEVSDHVSYVLMGCILYFTRACTYVVVQSKLVFPQDECIGSIFVT